MQSAPGVVEFIKKWVGREAKTANFIIQYNFLKHGKEKMYLLELHISVKKIFGQLPSWLPPLHHPCALLKMPSPSCVFLQIFIKSCRGLNLVVQSTMDCFHWKLSDYFCSDKEQRGCSLEKYLTRKISLRF